MRLIVKQVQQVLKKAGEGLLIVNKPKISLLETKLQGFMEGNNLGSGLGIFKNRTGNFLNFRTLEAGNNITLVESDDKILIEAGNGRIEVPNVFYVAVTSTSEGVYATVQRAINAAGTPTTQAEYLRKKVIVALDASVYTENIVLPTGLWELQFGNARLNGTVNWVCDNAERFGSTTSPELIIEKNANNVQSGITGAITVTRKSGGSVITLGTVRLIGFNAGGTIIIADGTNGGSAVFTTAVLSLVSFGLTGVSQILARNALMSVTDSGLNPTLPIEVGDITLVRDSTINSQDISLYANATTTRTIRALLLNTAGNVILRAIGSVKNWNTDASSGSEVATKVTSFPNNAVNLIRPNARAIGIIDAGNYYTSTNVEDALQEIAAFVGL